MKLEEILLFEDASQKIEYLKQYRRTPLPDKEQLLKDWDPFKHDVMDKELRPDEVKVIKPAKRDRNGKITQHAITKTDPVNRIPLPLEQDITNIHVAFTVGAEPQLTCDTEDEKEKELFKIIKLVDRKNKIKYHNKRIVRSWLSEQDVAEYWYTVEDKGFWKMVISKVKSVFGVNVNAERKLRCVIWSPFRGDKLYPFFDEANDYKGLGREYQVKVSSTQIDTYFMFVSDTHVYTWKRSNTSTWEVVRDQTFKHIFKKNPTIYGYRPETLCKKIRPIRARLETLLSNYGDCIDYNFAPKLVAEGTITGNQPKGSRGGIVNVKEGGKLYYLSWQQTPEAAKLEMDSLTERSYSLTNTPRISFEALSGLGNAFSGVSFQFAFMGAHMAVEMHAETIGEFLQRRYNFLSSAIGSINTSYEDVSETIGIDVEIVPYMINSTADKIKAASDAVAGGVASGKTGVILAGLVEVDMVEEELKAIEEKEAKANEYANYPIGSDVE